MIYLDHAASTPIHPEALEVLQSSFAQDFANPSSPHALGRKTLEQLESIKKDIIKIFQTQEKEIIFTGSATESNNTIINHFQAQGKILFSEADHPSITAAISLEKKCPALHNTTGDLDWDRLENQLQEHGKNISLAIFTHINSQSGVILDYQRLADLLKQYAPQAFFHLDFSQTLGKWPIPSELCRAVDGLTLSSHKMGGPKGIAAHLIPKGKHLTALLKGGSQQSGRSSTIAFPLIKSWHKAILINCSSSNCWLQMKEQTQKLYLQLKNKIPEIQFPFETNDCSPFIACFILPLISSDILMRHLEMEDIYISTTSACSSRHAQENPVLAALQVPPELSNNVLRISFSNETSAAELEQFAEYLSFCYKQLKSLLKKKRK